MQQNSNNSERCYSKRLVHDSTLVRETHTSVIWQAMQRCLSATDWHSKILLQIIGLLFFSQKYCFTLCSWLHRWVPAERWWPQGKHSSALGDRSHASRQPRREPWAPEQVWGLTGSRNHLLTQCRSLIPGSPCDCVLFHCRSLSAGEQTQWGGLRAGWQNPYNTHATISCARVSVCK